MKDTIKILGMGDSHLLSTGYANQGRYIFENLSNKIGKWDVHYQAWHYNGQPIKNATFKDGEKINYWIYPGGQHPWGADKLQFYINTIQPDIWFCLADSFMLVQEKPYGRINNWINNINFPCKTIFYFPSDGEPFPKGCETVLKKVSNPVAMSKFGQKQVKEQFNIDVDYIPHCTDTNIFYKIKNKNELKQKWTNRMHDSNGNKVDIRNKKVCLCVARNQGRKFLSRLMKIGKEFFSEEKNKDTIFLFKSNPNDPASGGLDLMSIARENGIADKIAWIYTDWFSGFTITEMREIYNLADVFILATSGEGWGVPFIEAMSCELPILTTNFTSPYEIVDGDKRQLANLQTTITGTFNVERGLVDVSDFYNKLQYLIDNEEVRKEIGKSNREKVLREYSTKVVLPLWENYMEKIIYE